MAQKKKRIWQPLKAVLSKPIISKKIDPYIVIFYSLFGAFFGIAFPDEIPLWKMLLTLLPILLISLAVLSLIGVKWRKKNGLKT